MKIKIYKNNCNSWDLYRVEVGAEYFLQNCKTKREAMLIKKKSKKIIPLNPA